MSDDSTDDTPFLARKEGAIVVDGGRVGLGQAMMLGLSEALRYKPDWIFSLDSDGQVCTTEIPVFLKAAVDNKAQLVLSSRFLNSDSIEYHYPFINWLGNRILVGILRLATGHPFTDSHGGIRLMKPHVLNNLQLIGRHTYVQETLIHIKRRGYKIIELPSRWKPRPHGDSRVLHSIFKYIHRTLPGLLFLLHLHWVAIAFAALFVVFSFTPMTDNSIILLSLAGLLLTTAIGIFYFARHPLKIDGHFHG